MKRSLAEQNAILWVIDASLIAEQVGLGNFINLILQSVFFFLSGLVVLFFV